jgi:hypothetical protein
MRRSDVDVNEFTTLVALVCIFLQEESDERSKSSSGQTNNYGKTDECENDKYGSRHDNYRSGLKAQASISTAPPNGSEATPMVLRAGRLPSNPATYAVLNVAKVSMSVRKHSVFFTS